LSTTILCYRLLLFMYGTATSGTSPLSLHDALPILLRGPGGWRSALRRGPGHCAGNGACRRRTYRGHVSSTGDGQGRLWGDALVRSEEHTSELQSRENLVCRLLLEKKKQRRNS